MSRGSAIFLLSMSTGCSADSEFSATDAAPYSDASTNDTTSSTTTTGTDTGGPPLPDAAYYGLDAELDLVAGSLDPATSSVQITLWSSEVESLCTHAVPITSSAPATLVPADPAVFGWWRLDLGDGVAEAPCEAWPSRTVWVGIGEYDARLDPSLAQHDWTDALVYGLYLQEFDGGPLYVVGIASTAELMAGAGALVTEPPVPDARYEAHSLVLMSLP